MFSVHLCMLHRFQSTFYEYFNFFFQQKNCQLQSYFFWIDMRFIDQLIIIADFRTDGWPNKEQRSYAEGSSVGFQLDSQC